MQILNTPDANVKHAPPDPRAAAWHIHAAALGEWAWQRLVNRTDVWGMYGTAGAWTAPPVRLRGRVVLTPGWLADHFLGLRRSDLVGLHSTSPQNTSLWCGPELDCHDAAGDPAANLAAALGWYARLRALGFTPLLTESNGAGGYHLRIIFARPVPTPLAYGFTRWLVGDFAAYGLTAAPETFPKQPYLMPGKFGNWLRLPGRHHTRAHWSRVYDSSAWLKGREAVAFILALRG